MFGFDTSKMEYSKWADQELGTSYIKDIRKAGLDTGKDNKGFKRRAKAGIDQFDQMFGKAGTMGEMLGAKQLFNKSSGAEALELINMFRMIGLGKAKPEEEKKVKDALKNAGKNEKEILLSSEGKLQAIMLSSRSTKEILGKTVAPAVVASYATLERIDTGIQATADVLLNKFGSTSDKLFRRAGNKAKDRFSALDTRVRKKSHLSPDMPVRLMDQTSQRMYAGSMLEEYNKIEEEQKKWKPNTSMRPGASREQLEKDVEVLKYKDAVLNVLKDMMQRDKRGLAGGPQIQVIVTPSDSDK